MPLRRTLLAGGAVLAATSLAGCYNNTLQEVGIPATATWNNFVTAIASPYSDLQALPIGNDIFAGIIPQGAPLAYCGDPADGSHDVAECDGTAAACEAACTNLGLTYYGTRYPYVVQIQLNRPTFQAGGITLTSDTAGGTVNSISFSIDSTGSLNLVAGLSEGTIPLSNFSSTGSALQGGYVLDNYTALLMSPADPNFVPAAYGSDPTYPDLVCDKIDSFDFLGYNTATATAGTYNCGIPINLSLTPPYASVGACISDSLEYCKTQGLKGKPRAACNAAQIGNCHAIFHVPSNLVP